MLLEVATQWVRNGYSVIPIGYMSKRPIIKSWEPYQTQLPTELEIKQWFGRNLRNIGLIVNHGLVVIDFDIQDVFDYWHKLFPVKTYMVKTRRGVHVYIKTTEPAANYHSDLLDIKAQRGYVLIPPSVHPSGYEYQVYQKAPIVSVNKLEDILPKEFTPAAEKVQVAAQYTGGCNDPWALADSAVDINAGAVADIRSHTPILSILPGAEQSSRDGRWWITLCPFHADHAPSFWIDTQRGMCGCRKCNIKDMDVINLYARLHNVDNRTAIYELSKRS